MIARLPLMGLVGAALTLASCGASVTGSGFEGPLVAAAHLPLPAPSAPAPRPAATPVVVATPTPELATPAPVIPTPAPRSTAALSQKLDELAAEYGAQVGVSLVELGGDRPLAWSVNGDQKFTAASTYKLPLLMMVAQQVADGKLDPNRQLCYDDSEYEDGWFDDYFDGDCLTISDLVVRVGHYSDNTAAHMLVAAMGGSQALNAYASAHGASESAFFDPNQTTSQDLARLLVNERSGKAGGTAAEKWLYPLLTNTAFEQGIPAGAPAGTTVVHKIGDIDATLNDAALITGAPHGDYVLVVMTDGPGFGSGWPLLAAISQAVAQYEAART